MANNFPTAQQLVEQAKANAKATKALMQKQTVASGAVVGGPIPPAPSPTPSPTPGGL